MKFVTLYIDLVIKILFIFFIGAFIYLEMSNVSWYDEIVALECMGTDISLVATWEEYKVFHTANADTLINTCLPIGVIILLDVLYINLRKTIKKKKKTKRKKTKKHNNKVIVEDPDELNDS